MQTQGPGRGRVRAFTSEDAEARVARHVTGLAIFLARPEALARALRTMRKAAARGGAGYDPAYHAALLRLARLKRDGRAATTRPVPHMEKMHPATPPARGGAPEGQRPARLSPAGRCTDQRPSNSAVER